MGMSSSEPALEGGARGRPSRPSRRAARIVAAGLSVLGLGVGALVLAQEASPRRQAPRPAPARPAFSGQASCVGCHAPRLAGPEEAAPGWQTAFGVWAQADEPGSHAKAMQPLFEERSTRMIRLLDPAAKGRFPAAEHARCLTCHGLSAPQVVTGASARQDDGVSCEGCHGPAASTAAGRGWLDQHYLEDWRGASKGYPGKALVEERSRHGFNDLKSLTKRAETCLGCHVTGGEKGLDHAMLAAGHPDVSFELARDLPAAPVHWREERSYLKGEDASAFRARQWAVGQAIAMRESMRALGLWASGARRGRLDYASFRCESCHHEPSPLEVATTRLGGYADDPPAAAGADAHAQALAARRQNEKLAHLSVLRPEAVREAALNEPPFDTRGFAATRLLADAIWGETSIRAEAFDEGLQVLLGAATLRDADLAQVTVQATKLGALAKQLAEDAERSRFTPDRRLSLVRRLGADARHSARLGFAAGEQSLAALEALGHDVIAKAPGGAAAKAVQAARRHLYDGADDLTRAPRGADARPVRYDAEAFGKLLEALASALAR